MLFANDPFCQQKNVKSAAIDSHLNHRRLLGKLILPVLSAQPCSNIRCIACCDAAIPVSLSHTVLLQRNTCIESVTTISSSSPGWNWSLCQSSSGYFTVLHHRSVLVSGAPTLALHSLQCQRYSGYLTALSTECWSL